MIFWPPVIPLRPLTVLADAKIKNVYCDSKASHDITAKLGSSLGARVIPNPRWRDKLEEQDV